MKPILIVLPSKGRPQKIEGFYESWRKTTDGLSEVITCLDDDDPLLNEYKKHKDITFDIDNGSSFSDACNRLFQKYPHFDYYYILSDDHRLRTKGWEKKFIGAIENGGGKGVAFGDDLINADKLASAAMVSGNIFRALGHIVLPGLIHMFSDTYWTEIGKQLNKLYFFPDIIVEHLHFTVKKSPVDSMYLSVNNQTVYKHDKQIYEKWKKTQMKNDIAKIEKYSK